MCDIPFTSQLHVLEANQPTTTSRSDPATTVFRPSIRNAKMMVGETCEIYTEDTDTIPFASP